MAEVSPRGDPGTGVGINFSSDGEGTIEDLDGVWEVVEVVKDDAELVEKQRVCLAERVRGIKVLVREVHIVELQILHAEEEVWEMSTLEEARGGAVGRNCLVVLAFCGEGVGEADPSGAEVRVHHRGFREEAARLSDLGDAEVVNAHGKPGAGFLGVKVGETVREKKESVGLIEFMEASKMEWIDGKIILVRVKDRGCDGERLFEAALGEQKLGFRKKKIGV